MDLLKKLKKIDQGHLLQFQNELSKEQQNQLYKSVASLPFKMMHKIYVNSYKDVKLDEKKIEPLEYFDHQEIDKNYYQKIGESFVDKYALVTLSGGSGSRFKYSGAKGTYEFTLKNKKTSMFQLFAEELLTVAKEYHVYIPWAIMTNKKNQEEIISFFEKNHYFHYPKDKIYFFTQKDLPILDVQGHCLLENKSKVLMASNGNGQVFQALADSKILETWDQLQIQYIQIANIDNILTKGFDPVFVGLMNVKNKMVGTKSFFKEDPTQNEYVFFRYRNHPYLDNINKVNSSLSYLKKEDRYLYRDVFSGISLFHIKALKKLQKKNLPYHRAYKNYKYIDPLGNEVTSEEKNSFKFEKFIFDGFTYFNDLLLYRVSKEEEFAPIKNKEGEKSIQTACLAYEKVKNQNKEQE